jgi:hypothetical protein
MARPILSGLRSKFLGCCLPVAQFPNLQPLTPPAMQATCQQGEYTKLSNISNKSETESTYIPTKIHAYSSHDCWFLTNINFSVNLTPIYRNTLLKFVLELNKFIHVQARFSFYISFGPLPGIPLHSNPKLQPKQKPANVLNYNLILKVKRIIEYGRFYVLKKSTIPKNQSFLCTHSKFKPDKIVHH